MVTKVSRDFRLQWDCVDLNRIRIIQQKKIVETQFANSFEKFSENLNS